MKKLYKSLLCIILSVMFVLSLFGCSNNTSSNTTTTNASTTQQTTTKSSTLDTAPTESATYNYSKIKQNADSIKSSFDSIMEKSRFRGTAYFKLGDDFEYVGENGYADKSDHIYNSITTNYRIGSLTKQFTAMAIMMLVQENKINLDDKISKFYPSYKYGKSISIENLLNMTAGLKDYMNEDGLVDNGVYPVEKLGYKLSSAKNSGDKNKTAILNWIMSQKTNFESGSKFEFSNSAYYLLGDIIEKVTKTSYEKYMQENIFKPLGMKNTSFNSTNSLATGYQDIYDSAWTLYPNVAYSSSGLISNISDLLIWVEAINDNELIDEELSNKIKDNSSKGYNYGAFCNDDKIYNDGKIDKFNAKINYNYDESLIFIALSNYSQSDPTKLFNKFSESIKSFYG